MLDDLCFAAAVVRRAGLGLAEEVKAAGFRAAGFLDLLTTANGEIMRYGADDGARVLQLSDCGYADFRPTLAACSLFFGSADPGPGPWWEQAQQLDAFSGGSGREAAVSSHELQADREPAGGIHIRRRGGATILFRAPTKFRFRPGHADHLQVSVHDGDRFLVEDVGSYSYNDPGKRWSGLASAVFHNVPTVDGDDPMERVSRFLWLPWTACRLEVNEADRLVASFEGTNHFLVRREVQIRADHCIVLDHIEGYREAELALRWHGRGRAGLEQLAVSCSNPGVQEKWYHEDEVTGLGFHAPTYHHVEPAWCREWTVRAAAASFRTVIRWGRDGGREG
jgi:hypothetical protein